MSIRAAIAETLEPRTLLSASLESYGFTPVTWQGQEVYAQADTWIVKFRNMAGSTDEQLALANKVLDRADARYEAKSYLGEDGLMLVTTPAGTDQKSLIASLSTLGRFVSAEPDLVLTSSATMNDVQFYKLWGLESATDVDIDAPQAWDRARGAGVVVAVLDTGVDWQHVDLASNIWTNPREIAGNGIDDDGNGYRDDVRGWDFAYNDNDPMDDYGHGTHVAGTIAAIGNNSRGVVGVAPEAKILPLKFMTTAGYGTASAAISAINYAIDLRDAGANIRVMNASVGGFTYTDSMADAISRLGDAGIMFVAAAGNDARNIDYMPNYPASFKSSNMLTVAATNQNEQLSYFSNYGTGSVQLAAPGETIRSTAMGGGYIYMSGTSMAAPHVAAAAALAFSYQPGASVASVRNAILQGVDVKSQYSGRVSTSGRLNAFNTLNMLAPGPTYSVPTAPAAPSNMTATAVGSTYISLAWQDNSSNEDGFKIQRSVDGVNFTRIATVGANVRSYVDTSVTPGTTYSYRVRSYNETTWSAVSNAIIVRTLSTNTSALATPAAVFSSRPLALNGDVDDELWFA